MSSSQTSAASPAAVANSISISFAGSSSTGTSSDAPRTTSFTLNKSSASHTSTPTTASRSLPHRSLQLEHDEEFDDEQANGAPAHEAVTGFDLGAGGAIPADGFRDDEKRELVIPVTSKNRWWDRPGVNIRRGKKTLLPKEVQALREEAEARGGATEVNGGGKNVELGQPSLSYGLSHAQPPEQLLNEDTLDETIENARPIIPSLAEEAPRPLTDDEIALRALIRESKGETEIRSDLVIEPIAGQAFDESERERRDTNGYADVAYDETSSFRADVASRPDSASLEAYNAIPVEEFGAALLRGMGWEEGKPIGRGNYSTNAPSDRAKAPRIPERRPGFLGIGAKNIAGAKGAEAEFGAWGKAVMLKSSRKSAATDGQRSTEGIYMPVMMRNKMTGEMITEDELAALQREAKEKTGSDDWKARRDRNLEQSGRDSDRERRDHDYRRRDYDRDDDRDHHSKRRTDSSRRESSPASSRHSRRRYDDGHGSGQDDRYHREEERDHGRRGHDSDRVGEREKGRERDGPKSHRYKEDDRYNSRNSSANTSRYGRDRDYDRDRDSDSYKRRRDDVR